MKSINKKDHRDKFLKYFADIYLNNPDIPVLKDTIYYGLSKFNFCEDKVNLGSNDSLVSVQLQLNNKFRNNDGVVTFLSSTGYCWVIQNRVSKNDDEFLKSINNGVKLYISVKPSNIYKIADTLFDFMIDENIVMECKIFKEMRNDVFVCRLTNKDDTLKVCNYLNKFKYKFNTMCNPFLYGDGRVSIVRDNDLSYNNILANLIKIYFEEKRNNNTLLDVSSDDFIFFINKLIESFKLDNNLEYKNYLDVINLIIGTLDNSLKLNDFFEKNIICNNNRRVFSKSDEDKILYVINSLANYYSVSDVHDLIMKYIETGNINLFTRKNDIRTIISNNFSNSDVKNIISDLGWRALVAASKLTYNKYGSEQLFSATQKLLDDEVISGFTRDNDVRSYLGLVIPSQLLKEVIHNKLEESGMDVTNESLSDLVLDEGKILI